MGTYITFPELFILIPLFGGIICFLLPKRFAANFAMFFSLATLTVAIVALKFSNDEYISWNNVSYEWLKQIGSTYYLGIDGVGRMLTLLTAIGFPIAIYAGLYKKNLENIRAFVGLLLLAEAGIMGVFLAYDALVFYFYWELALIPMYFLCSIWGGDKRIQTTFKFFVYTFIGSLLMLVGIIYLYSFTEAKVFADGTRSLHSFSLTAFYHARVPAESTAWLFWLFFAAFAIKMPIFPLHTWQPATYDQSPTAVTMILSGIMVKMGLLGVIRWLIPIFPAVAVQVADIVIILSLIGIVYASCLAIVQDNLKKLVAYSSIAHIGLMCAALFSSTTLGIQGAFLQMFNHGINIIALWLVVDVIEKHTGVKRLSELGGLATKAPSLTIALVVIACANIALPLTNGFVGEFMMFAGLWKMNPWYAAVAGLGVILAAVYTLNMIQKIFFGEVVQSTSASTDINLYQKVLFGVLITGIIYLGIFPQQIIDMTSINLKLLGNLK